MRGNMGCNALTWNMPWMAFTGVASRGWTLFTRTMTSLLTPAGTTGGVVSDNWYTDAIFACGWEGGSDVKNTTGAGTATGDGVFTGGEDSYAGLSRITSGQLAGTASLQMVYDAAGANDGSAYYDDPTNISEVTCRCRVKLTENGMTTADDYAHFMNIKGPEAGWLSFLRIQYRNVAGVLKMRCYTANDSTTYYQVGSDVTVVLNTEYVVELYFKTSTEVGFKIWDYNTKALVGSGTDTNAAHIRSTDPDKYLIGTSYGHVVSAQTTVVMDNFGIWAGTYRGCE